MKYTAFALAAFAAVGCSQPKTAQPKTERAVRPTTATEVFNLRTKCQQIVDTDVEEGRIGGVGNALKADIKSHYNPVTNHCYAQVTVLKNFNVVFPGIPTDYCAIALYDAQTLDLLLSTDQKNGNQVGLDFTDDTKTPLSDYGTVMNKVHLLMTQQ